jgi:hypothetical protein
MEFVGVVEERDGKASSLFLFACFFTPMLRTISVNVETRAG